MKKLFIISTLILSSVLVLTGCSKNSQIAKEQNSRSGENGQERRMPDFGQPERQPDIRGVVKSVLSNEVTVLKIDLPNPGHSASSTSASGTVRNNEQAGKAGAALAITGSGTRMMPGGGMMAGDPGGAGEQNSDSRAQMLEKLKAMSTGEEKIIIPVGIKMLKGETTNKKRTMVEATLADITADKSITVWLNSTITDKKVAEFVLIN